MVTFDMSPFRELYPFTSRWFEVGGQRMHFVDEGAGDAIVCVHGNPTWSFYFRDLIAELRESHRVIAMDHIGCGLSDKPSDSAYEYTLERRVRDLEALLDHLGLDSDLTFVVHDWGGMIGCACALRRVNAVRRMIVLNTAAFLLPAGKRLPWRLWAVRNLGPLSAWVVRGLNGFVRTATRVGWGCSQPMRRRVRQAYLAPHDNWANRIATLRFVQDIPMGPRHPSHDLARWVSDHLYQLRDAAMMIVWGRKDFVFDDAFYAEWVRRFPNAEAHAFDDAGHLVMEDAGDRIVKLVRGFLDRNPIGSATGAPAEAVK